MNTTIPGLTDWDVLGIWVGCDIIITIIVALIARPYVDRDGNGKITADELPKLPGEPFTRPIKDGRLYDYGLVSTIDVLWSSFSFSAAYGGITVITCNWALVDHVPLSVGYLMTIFFAYLAMVFMCAFACNAIHVLTSHPVHFIYYACGYIPMTLYWGLPSDSGLVVVAIFSRLLLNTFTKYYVWPNYPSAFEISPSFKYDENNNIIRVSTPENYKEKNVDYLQAYWPFPNYEIMNGVQASSMCTGGFVGAIVAAICRATNSTPGTLLWSSFLAGFLVGLLFVIVLYNNHRWDSIERYYPRTITVFMVSVTSLFIASNINRDQFHATPGPEFVALVVLAHLTHVIILSCLIWAYVAASSHLGFLSLCRRCIKPGDGGIHFYQKLNSFAHGDGNNDTHTEKGENSKEEKKKEQEKNNQPDPTTTTTLNVV